MRTTWVRFMTPLLLWLAAPGPPAGLEPWADAAALPWAFLAPWVPLPWLWAVQAEAAAGRRRSWRTWALDLAVGYCCVWAAGAWVAMVSPVGLAVGGLVLALPFPLAGRALASIPGRWACSLTVPLVWTALEMALRAIPLVSLPYVSIAPSAAGWPVFLPLAALGGAPLVTAILACPSGVVIDWLRGRPGASRVGPAVVLVLAVISWAWPATGPAGEPVRLAAIQAAVPQDLKGTSGGAEESWKRHAALTLKAGLIEPPPDLVVWPETMFPSRLSEPAPERSAVLDRWGSGSNAITFTAGQAEDAEMLMVRRHIVGSLLGGRSALLLGAIEHGRRAGAWRTFNTALLFGPDGMRAARYRKRHMVPMGEWNPFLAYLPGHERLRAWAAGAAVRLPDMQPGHDVPVMDLARRDGTSTRFGVAICFDNAYPDIFREAANRGAGLHIVLSNEGWYPGSRELEQLAAMAVLRAAESGRPVVRATNTGLTCVADPQRGIRHALPIDEQGVMSVSITPRSGTTGFQVWGDAFGGLCVLLAGAALCLRRGA